MREQCERLSSRLQDEHAVRETLEEQIETLNDVNTALEQRSNALLRRVELNASVIQDGQDLKRLLRDAEVDNETLVQTVRAVGKRWTVKGVCTISALTRAPDLLL